MRYRTVLEIDAAWTLEQPSGVALAMESSKGWRLIAAAASYQHFLAFADSGLAREIHPCGSTPEPGKLPKAASMLSGQRVDLVAIDMPLSHVAITGRRAADDAVSRAYGARKAGTHTPSVTRPGRISDDLREAFATCKYLLQTETINTPGLIEVYPHPALVELASAPERLPYKTSKVRSYWPMSSFEDRRLRLFRQWADITALLEGKISGVVKALPELGPNASGRQLKALEDKIDAVVCVWVAICALEGQAVAFGDSEAAIWIPKPLSPQVVTSQDALLPLSG